MRVAQNVPATDGDEAVLATFRDHETFYQEQKLGENTFFLDANVNVLWTGAHEIRFHCWLASAGGCLANDPHWRARLGTSIIITPVP